MSPVVIGLLFLACGWKLYKDSIYTRYLALRNTGHPQYFGGALCATLIFALSYSLDAFSFRVEFYRETFESALANLPVFAAEETRNDVHHFARILLWAFPVTWLLVRLLNLPFHRSPSLLMAAARKTRIIDELEETIYYCLRAKPQLSLAITTKSKKVYIGVPKRHSPDPDRDRIWIALWPLASGYRDDRGSLHLNTFYDEVHDGAQTRPLRDYQVVLPLAEVQVAQAFDLLAYAKYQQIKFERTRSPPSKYISFSDTAFGLTPDAADAETQPIEAEGPDRASMRHSAVSKIVEQIVTVRDRYLLRTYGYFTVSMTLSVLALPYGAKYAAAFALIAGLACFESVEPISVRIEKWWLSRQRTRQASLKAGETLEKAARVN